MILCALYVFNDNSLYAHLVFVAWGAPDSPVLPSHCHKNIHVLFLWGLGVGSGGHSPLLFYVQRQHLHSARVYSYAKFSGGLVLAERRQVEVVTLALFVLLFWANRTWSHMFGLKKNLTDKEHVTLIWRSFCFGFHLPTHASSECAVYPASDRQIICYRAAVWLVQYMQAHLQTCNTTTVSLMFDSSMLIGTDDNFLVSQTHCVCTATRSCHFLAIKGTRRYRHRTDCNKTWHM